jgi:hypothetical protein
VPGEETVPASALRLCSSVCLATIDCPGSLLTVDPRQISRVSKILLVDMGAQVSTELSRLNDAFVAMLKIGNVFSEKNRPLMYCYRISIVLHLFIVDFFENFDHSSYSKYLFKNIKILSKAQTTLYVKTNHKKVNDNHYFF